MQRYYENAHIAPLSNSFISKAICKKLSSAQAMENGIFLPGADDFGSKWSKTNEKRRKMGKISSFLNYGKNCEKCAIFGQKKKAGNPLGY